MAEILEDQVVLYADLFCFSEFEAFEAYPSNRGNVFTRATTSYFRYFGAIAFVFFNTYMVGMVHAQEGTERPARAAQCFLEVNSDYYFGGECSFAPLDKAGSFRISFQKGLNAQLKVEASSESPQEGIGSWSGPNGDDASSVSVGALHNTGRGCWSGFDLHDPAKSTNICAWDKGQQLYLGPTPVYPQQHILAWGEREGMYARIISSSGLNTEHASIEAERSRDGAIQWCRSNNDYSASCIKQTLGINHGLAPPKVILRGNCKTRTYTDYWGRNLKQLDDDILDVDNNQKLGQSAAAGSGVASTAFDALCPEIAGRLPP